MKKMNIYHHFRFPAMLAIYFFFLNFKISAQVPDIFFGGQGSGSGMISNACPAVIVNTSAGGSGDGSSSLMNACPLVSVAIFTGGMGGGSSKIYNSCPAVLVNTNGGGANSGNASVYQNCSLTSVNLSIGGTGSGGAKLYNSCPAIVVNLFQGGSSDGSSYTGISCPAAANPLVGGSGDGAASVYSSCASNFLNIFSGGASSGSGKLWSSCASSPISVLYGGSGDGYASLYQACPKVITNVFAGGSYDGHASLWNACSLTSVNVFSGGSNDGSGKIWKACNGISVNYARGGSCSGSYAIASVCTGTWLTHACFCASCCPIPIAAGNISGPSVICEAEKGVSFSVPAIQDASGYQWVLPAGANIASGGNTNSITVNFSTGTAATKISVLGTSSCGNGLPSSDFPITIKPLPAAAGSISGSTSLCQGDLNQTYSVPSIANATSYNWTFPSGINIVSGNNTNSVVVDFTSSASSGNIILEGVDSCGKGTSSSLSILVSPLPAAASLISGKTSVCQSEAAVVYSIGSIANATSYNWVLPSGASIVSGSNTNSITVDFSSSASSGSISVEGINACGNGVISTLSLNLSPLPAAAGPISGKTNVCQSEAGVVYSVGSIANATSYNWVLPSGASIVSGSNTNSITVDFTSSASSGSISVEGINACGKGVISTLSLNLSPLPAAASLISGKTSVCQSEAGVVYSVGSIANATSYNWVLPSGASIVSGSNTNSITVDFSSAASSGSISVEGINACGNGVISTLSLNLSPLPAAAGPISGKTNVCQSEAGVVYSVGSIANATSYNWVLPSGASIVSGSNTNSITVDFTSSASSGSISVEGINACGKGVISTLSLSVNLLPSAASTPSGSLQLCQGDKNILYSVSPITNASSYSWTLPSGASIVSGLNTNSITLDFSPSASSGNIIVQGINACGNGVSSTLSVQVNPVPPANAGSNQSICESKSIAIGANAIPGNIYSWQPASSLDFANISNPKASPTQTTTYTLTETSPTTACFAVNTVTITVHANPVPVISQIASNLQSSPASTYQWYLNGGLINGATSQTYSPGPDGDYTIEVMDLNSCQGTSSPYTFISTSITNSPLLNEIRIYPNPHASSFVVSGKSRAGDGLYLRLMSLQDQELMRIAVEDGKDFAETMNTEKLAAGIYILSVHSSKGVMLKKIIKIN